MTLFHGEDFHILLSSHEMEVTFKNRSDPRKPVVLMRGGKVVSSRAKPNLHLNHLIIESVGEGDEGLYIMKNPQNPDDVKQISLIVRGTEPDTLGAVRKVRKRHEAQFELKY